MGWTLVNSATLTFADGASPGHTYTLPSGAPSTGELDIVCVNSDTTITSVSSSGGASWTEGANHLGNEAAQLWYRFATGGEPTTVVIITGSNDNTSLSWSRWDGGKSADVNAVSHQDGTYAVTTPAVNTGALAVTGELVVAFAAMSFFNATTMSTPVWSTGYTNMTGPSQTGTGGSDVGQWVGYNTNAGTAAETPNVSWTNDAQTQYMLVQTFEPNLGTQADAGTPAGTGAVTAAISGVSIGMTIQGH